LAEASEQDVAPSWRFPSRGDGVRGGEAAPARGEVQKHKEWQHLLPRVVAHVVRRLGVGDGVALLDRVIPARAVPGGREPVAAKGMAEQLHLDRRVDLVQLLRCFVFSDAAYLDRLDHAPVEARVEIEEVNLERLAGDIRRACLLVDEHVLEVARLVVTKVDHAKVAEAANIALSVAA